MNLFDLDPRSSKDHSTITQLLANTQLNTRMDRRTFITKLAEAFKWSLLALILYPAFLQILPRVDAILSTIDVVIRRTNMVEIDELKLHLNSESSTR